MKCYCEPMQLMQAGQGELHACTNEIKTLQSIESTNQL